ncbi:MAG: type II toxin-antitoxin system PemK/MazF family toxin [Bacteroidota bacterium]
MSRGEQEHPARGDVFLANLNPTVGSEQRGIRPVVVLQNDLGNRTSPTLIVAPLTSRLKRPDLPTHVPIPDGFILLEQLRTIDRRRLKEKIGRLDAAVLARVDAALRVSLGLHDMGEGDSVEQEVGED